MYSCYHCLLQAAQANLFKYETFGSGAEKESISTSQEAVNKQQGILWKSINYALPHNLCSFYEATKETKLLNPLEAS